LVLGSIFLFSVIAYNVNRNLDGATRKAADYYCETRSKSIANSTANMILSKLSDSTNWRVNTPATSDFMGGSVEYTIKDSVYDGEPVIRVAVDGSYGGVTKSVVVLTKPRSDVPPFFKYAAVSDGDLTVNGANNTFRDAFNTNWNANIHTNANMILNIPSNFLLNGFATYTNTITANWGNITISPNQNPTGEAAHHTAPAVSIPSFDPATYSAKATVTHNSDATYSGNITLGTRENPAIIYCKKKLFIQGTVTGYGVFIVKEDIEVTGSLTMSSVDSANSKMGLYTQQKIMINNENTTAHAQMLATNEVVVNAKNAQIHGSIATKNKCTFNGEGIKLYYRPALDALTSPFWSVAGQRLTALHHYE